MSIFCPAPSRVLPCARERSLRFVLLIPENQPPHLPCPRLAESRRSFARGSFGEGGRGAAWLVGVCRSQMERNCTCTRVLGKNRLPDAVRSTSDCRNECFPSLRHITQPSLIEGNTNPLTAGKCTCSPALESAFNEITSYGEL